MQNPTEHQQNLVIKEISSKVHSLPLAAEIFSVAVALATFGVVVRPSSEQIDHQYIQVQASLENGCSCDALAVHPCNCTSYLCETIKLARKTWNAEKMELLSRLAEVESNLEELKKMRAEDAKANEKVVRMFSIKEQRWKDERKRFWHENEALKRKVETLLDKVRIKYQEPGACFECKQKERCMTNLKEKLTEKEFLLITTMEEAKSEQLEKNELAGKLAVAEMLADYVQENLDNKVKEHDECLVNFGLKMSALISTSKQLKVDLKARVKELEASRQEGIVLDERLKAAQESNEKLLSKLKNLKKDVKANDVVLSVLLRKNGLAAAENFELARKLEQAKARRRNSERERDSWRRIAEERINESSPASLLKPGCSFGRKVDCGVTTISKMQRLHAEQVYNLHCMYKNQIKDLGNRARYYLDRLQTLENQLLCCRIEEDFTLSIENETSEKYENFQAVQDYASYSGSFKGFLEANLQPSELQLSCCQSLRVNYMESGCGKDLEFGKLSNSNMRAKATVDISQYDGFLSKKSGGNSIRLWAAKGWQVAHLEQRHWQEIDAFERQMRVKDERMESFRQRLLIMDEVANKMRTEIKELKKDIKKANQRILEGESLLKEKEIELEACKEGLINFNITKLTKRPDINSENRVKFKQEEFALILVDSPEIENMMNGIFNSPEGNYPVEPDKAEAELFEQDATLAILEAKVVHSMMQYGKVKNSRVRESYETLIDKSFLDVLLADGFEVQGPVLGNPFEVIHMEVDASLQSICSSGANVLCAHDVNERCQLLIDSVKLLAIIESLISPTNNDESQVLCLILDGHSIKQVYRKDVRMLQSHEKRSNGVFFIGLPSPFKPKTTVKGTICILQFKDQQAMKVGTPKVWFRFLKNQ